MLIIGFGAILQGLFLSGLYIFSKKHQSKANRILGLFLLALIWEGINSFLPLDYIGDYSIGYYFELPESKLFMPILFFHYVLLKIGRRKKYKTLLQAGYSLGCLIVSLTIINLTAFLFKGIGLRELLGEQFVEQIFMTQQIIAYLFSVGIMFLSIYEVKKARILAENVYSNLEKSKLNWLMRFVVLFIPMVLLWGLELIRILFELPDMLEVFVAINWFLIFILLYYMSFKAFTQESLFQDIRKVPRLNDYKTEVLQDELMRTIEEAMRYKKYYKNPDLKLYEFAKSIEISPRKISAAIKAYKKMNFSTWVNSYRVEDAIELVRQESALSIEGIGLEVGFKSRSAMYNAFQKIKVKTPGEFK